MKPDELEQRLGQVPSAPLPADWKRQILRAAHAARSEATDAASAPERERITGWGMLRSWFSQWSAPWTVLAAGWALVLVLNQASSWIAAPERSAAPASSQPNTRASALASVRQHRSELLALAAREESEVVASTPRHSVLPPNPLERPRGQCQPKREEWDGTQECAPRSWA